MYPVSPLLEFDRYGEYEMGGKPNGLKFRAWRLLRPVPELGIEAGQTLFQSDPAYPGVGLSQFHVRDAAETPASKRYLDEGDLIALFGSKGPPEWDPMAAQTTVSPQSVALPSVSVIAPEWLEKFGKFGVYKLERPVKGVKLPVGAFLVRAEGWMQDPPVRRAWKRRLSKDEMYALRQGWTQMNERCPLSAVISFVPRHETEEHLAVYLRDAKRWGLKRKNWISDLCAVVPLPIEIAQPIEASSDDAALFELLSEVGGRLPSARAAEGRAP